MVLSVHPIAPPLPFASFPFSSPMVQALHGAEADLGQPGNARARGCRSGRASGTRRLCCVSGAVRRLLCVLVIGCQYPAFLPPSQACAITTAPLYLLPLPYVVPLVVHRVGGQVQSARRVQVSVHSLHWHGRGWEG
jgi:hypothetical protein